MIGRALLSAEMHGAKRRQLKRLQRQEIKQANRFLSRKIGESHRFLSVKNS